MRTAVMLRLPALLLLALAAGCGGGYSGGPASGGSGGSGGGGSQARSMEEFFGQSVQPQMDFCRSCHVPGGIADVDKGRQFQLGSDRTQDLARLKASWERLGGNTPTSRLLLMASGQETPHTGGAPWAQGSAAYTNMEILLKCFGDPSGCLALLAGGTGTMPQLPLLGSSHAGHLWYDFCAGQPDDALLPPDPRTLIVPGVNQGKAVAYNFYWKSCSGPADGQPYPTTCGELRTRQAHGAIMMKGNGTVGQNIFFSGDHTDGLWQLPASTYNGIWQSWGLSSRPANFDALVAQRYGLGLGTTRNPYPLAGEDPATTNGGSGQLPTAITQVRTADGAWTGQLGFRCNMCHSDQIGTGLGDGTGPGVIYGSGNGTVDFDLFLDEVVAQSNNLPLPGSLRVLPFTFNKTRGVSNALQIQIEAIIFPDDIFTGAFGDPLANVLKFIQLMGASPGSGEINATPWWNLGRKPSKFSNGLLPGDNLRAGSAFDIPIMRQPFPFADIAGAKAWTRANSLDPQLWYMSLKSPQYPGAIDTALAEQGAILFHSKNLWASEANSTIPKPEGNGACAGCHGAYSPRYVNDPDYLDTPALEGTVGYIVPLETIGTDPVYSTALTEDQAELGSKYMFALYSETYGKDQDCTIQTREALRGSRKLGYLAPPLHGIWATAPYFHNGSVPDIWGVLQPAERPVIWRRVSTPAAPEQEGKVVMGFDNNFLRAYDPQKLGWKYDAIQCEGGFLFPDCDVNGPTPQQQFQNAANASSSFSYNLSTAPSMAMSQAQIEKRKIFNTYDYAHDNHGHAFTSVLTDSERRAIIEYLKTL